MNQTFGAILVFIIGACLGSFLSVLISRLNLNKNGIIAGRSECPHCHHQLTARNLIPILSWLFQRGKCSYCHKPISLFYPALEISSGLLFLISFFSINFPLFAVNNFFNWNTPDYLKLIYLELLNLILLAISFSDLQTKKIPNIFLLIWILFTLPAAIFQDWLSIGLGLVLNLALFGGQWIISKGRWIGAGDVFFSIGMAFLLGWQKSLLAIFISYFLGSLIAIFLLLSKKADRKSALAFAPFLVIGTIIAFYFGQDFINWYLSIYNF